MTFCLLSTEEFTIQQIFIASYFWRFICHDSQLKFNQKSFKAIKRNRWDFNWKFFCKQSINEEDENLWSWLLVISPDQKRKWKLHCEPVLSEVIMRTSITIFMTALNFNCDGEDSWNSIYSSSRGKRRASEILLDKCYNDKANLDVCKHNKRFQLM